MGTASSAASLSLAKGRASCSTSQQTVGSVLLPECERRMCSLYLLHSDGAHRLHSSSRPLCLAWNPNLNNHGMVRLLVPVKQGAYCALIL